MAVNEYDKRVEVVPVSKIEPIPENVREMTEEEFNALCRSIEENGYVELIQVVELPNGKYRIVNGQHRFEALVNVFGLTEIKVVVLGRMCRENEDPERDNCWDEARYWTEVIRLNNIRGDWLKPELAKKILWLWEYYKKKGYDKERLKEKLGFTGSRTLFDKVFEQVKNAVPPEIRKRLEENKDKITTVEELSKVLNEIMKKYGSTLDSGFIIFEFAGAEHILVKSTPELYETVRMVAEAARDNGVSVADVLYRMLVFKEDLDTAVARVSGQ